MNGTDPIPQSAKKQNIIVLTTWTYGNKTERQLSTNMSMKCESFLNFYAIVPEDFSQSDMHPGGCPINFDRGVLCFSKQ